MAVKHYLSFLILLLVTLCGTLSQPTQITKTTKSHDKTNGLIKDGAHVCTYQETITVQVVQTYLSNRITTETYETCCVDGWFRCSLYCNKTRMTTKMFPSSRLVTKYMDRDVYYCCSGWTRPDDTTAECVTPICNIKCRNGGQCVGPDKCKCKDGYSGAYCQLDNDECKNPQKNNCEQVCSNTDGGFKCSCKRGYKLNNDGRTCQEIDECAAATSPCSCVDSNDVNCRPTCTNTQGSYFCECSKGYSLNSAMKCEDINECFLNAKQCDHKCVNKPGSFECLCFDGYQHNATQGKCVDINECLTDNGGCSDQCVNINGSYVCLCPDGKYLDGKTCKNITSRTKSERFCDSDAIGMLACESHLEVINITSVFYGRISDKKCQNGNYKGNLQCTDQSAIQNVAHCNGTPSCIVMMDSFKDPCPGIEKYLEVSYKCEPQSKK